MTCVNALGREGDCHTEATVVREPRRGQRHAWRRQKLLSCVCHVHSYICTLIKLVSCPLIQ